MLRSSFILAFFLPLLLDGREVCDIFTDWFDFDNAQMHFFPLPELVMGTSNSCRHFFFHRIDNLLYILLLSIFFPCKFENKSVHSFIYSSSKGPSDWIAEETFLRNYLCIYKGPTDICASRVFYAFLIWKLGLILHEKKQKLWTLAQNRTEETNDMLINTTRFFLFCFCLSFLFSSRHTNSCTKKS